TTPSAYASTPSPAKGITSWFHNNTSDRVEFFRKFRARFRKDLFAGNFIYHYPVCLRIHPFASEGDYKLVP
ncbi:MAG: hypothetical protein IJN91_04120, partial [Alphaproteobacteria bacterium]|nr:hypothetical protein [Alphaproteobacteria bacterium]